MNQHLRRLLPAALPLLLALAAGCNGEDTPPTPEADAGPSAEGCTPGEKRCLGQTLKVCDAAGTAWTLTDCAQQGQRCLTINLTPQCTSKVCDPHAPGCSDSGLIPRTCSADGSRWINGTACALSKGEICVAGRCANACSEAAKTQQNIGCTFYPVNLENENPDQVGVVVSNPNKVTATVTLRTPQKVLGSKKVGPGKLETFIIGAGAYMLEGTGKKVHAFKLTANLPVAAYQFSPLNRSQQRSNDASVLISKPALGKRYIAFSAPVSAQDSASYVTIVGTAAGTSVTVTPSFDTRAGGGVPAIKADAPYTTTLGEQEILQLSTATIGADLTGTRIAATKPVAVFGGHTCAQIPSNKSFCDHIQEQMFPQESWGWGYLAAKFMPRGATAEDDWWRILAGEDGTEVTLSGDDTLPRIPTLKAGEYYQVRSPGAFVVKSNKPVALAHYSLGQEEVTQPLDQAVYGEGFQTPTGCTKSADQTNMGDPALSIAVPFAQYRTVYDFLTPDTYRYDFLTITVPAGQKSPDILLDDKVLSQKLKPIGSTGYRYLRLRLSDGAHRIKATTPFGIEVHGYDCNVSYAYSGGQNLKPINPIN